MMGRPLTAAQSPPALPVRQLVRSGGEQPPGGVLPEGEEGHDPVGSRRRVRDAGFEVARELDVGEHDFLAV